MTQKKDIGKILRQFGLVFVALFIIVFMSIKSDVFLTSQNIINILRQISINGILAVGMTFVILTGGIDLSVGSVVCYHRCYRWFTASERYKLVPCKSCSTGNFRYLWSI